jgi:hypothetical protein
MNGHSSLPSIKALTLALVFGVAGGFLVGHVPFLDCPRCDGERKIVIGIEGSGTLTGTEFPRVRPILYTCQTCNGRGRLA